MFKFHLFNTTIYKIQSPKTMFFIDSFTFTFRISLYSLSLKLNIPATELQLTFFGRGSLLYLWIHKLLYIIYFETYNLPHYSNLCVLAFAYLCVLSLKIYFVPSFLHCGVELHVYLASTMFRAKPDSRARTSIITQSESSDSRVSWSFSLHDESCLT